ncbi:MAG TPA: histidine--tRNA ligase [Ruminococcaceae bacterium]|nr:histidine--tRNA ligase [Oscillospiraceae bacterium]
MELIKAQKGTQDLLPEQAYKRRYVENVMSYEAVLHGFGEIRTPVFEDTRLFQRSVGDTTDVVQKEMYTFEDKGGRSITLKPEGTAGVVRAFIEHGLYNEPLPSKLYYFTPCYRYENTQAGRLREFHQFGAEMFGSASPAADAEMIILAKNICDSLGIRGLKLEVNSIGCPDCRAEYTRALKAYFEKNKGRLCETCISRLDRNPMRILDCKNPSCAEVAAGAPKITDYLCDDCRSHFKKVLSYLDGGSVEYTVNPSIVRGLDYYTRTVFEFVSGDLGAQSTLCGGGRYDGLVEQMGGRPMPALGFAFGIERVMLVMKKQRVTPPADDRCEVFIASIGEKAQEKAFSLACTLRDSDFVAMCDLNGRSLNAQMKYANKIKAGYTLVIGDDELENGKAFIKNMDTGERRKIDLGGGFADDCIQIITEDEDTVLDF